MCGIAGIIGRIGDENRAALARMNSAMRHRGPDDEGTWASPADPRGFGCLLTQRRLSILDLSPCGHQPMIDPVTGQAIVFNGEIYNYADLRQELMKSGQQFQSSGDTAVMLRALGVWGARNAIARLRGMFAFGLWDEKTRKLVLGRDPLGIKPLYVARNPDPKGDWSMAFASEVRAILASGLLGKPRLNPAAVASVIWNGFVAGPQTMVRGVESLATGQVLEFDDRGQVTKTDRYWTFDKLARGQSAGEDEVRHAIEESVRLHLASDVPLGVFLSGGIDSSAVANLAQRQSGEPVHTFTLTFEEPAYDEGPHARRVAEAIGSRHQEVMLTESRFLEGFEKATGSLDQPTFDGINSYFVSRAVREAGITVALTGTGGDELFGGYSSFRRLSNLARLVRFLPGPASSLAAAGVALLAKMTGPGGSVGAQTGWVKLSEMLRGGENVRRHYQLAYALFMPGFQRELLAGEGAMTSDGLSDELRNQLAAEIEGRSPLAAVSILEQRMFLGERLLRDTDAASMAVSLETRLPLVDQKVSETLNRVPDALRYEPLGKKALLRRVALAGLDPAIFERPKSGFVLPFDTWIRKGAGPAMKEMLLDEKRVAAVGLKPVAVKRLWDAFNSGGQGLYWSRMWGVYALVDWCHRHGVLL
jgi:asparagine synthase (glutamine-hydrolysing)